MIVYFLRHASAGKPKNDAKKDEKRPLDAEGVEQCRLMGRALSALEVQVDAILSSPLKRATQTASLVGNEMGHDGKLELTPALRLRARLISASSLFAWWNHLLARTLRSLDTQQVREEVAALAAGEIPTYVPEAVPASARSLPGGAFRARAADRYAANVRRMLSLARAAGVPIVFAVPAANLRSPPGVSAHAEGFAATADFDAALRAGRALRESGKPEQALERLDAAVALSPAHAGAHYARGEALRALGRDDEARAAYREAVDRDVRTHRITSALEQALLDALQAEGAAPIDLRPLFHAQLDDATADALFVDHLHPTAEGHARIAEALLPAAAAALGLGAG